MRNLCFFVCMVLLLSCSHKDNICIRGQLEKGNGRMLYLSLLTVEGPQMVDSAKVIKNSFRFEVKPDEHTPYLNADEPGFFLLSFSPENALTTLAHQGQTVFITAEADNLIGTYRVQGPEDARLMWKLDSALNAFVHYTDTLLQIYKYYMDDDSVRSEVERRYNQAVAVHQQFLRDFIAKHPSSFSSTIAFYQGYNNLRFFDEKEETELLRMLVDSLACRYPDSRYVIYLRGR